MDFFENELTRKIDDYAPYISVIYLSDKTKDWKWHLVPWEWTLDLRTFLQKLKKSWYNRPISIKLDFKPTELASREKLKKQFRKVKSYYNKFFVNATSEEDETHEDNENKKNTQNSDTQKK
jgi:sugar phosphate isomerase/epimerase